MHYKRRVVLASFGFAVGAGMVAAGVVLPKMIWLAVGGFVVMLVCGIWALNSWRHMAGVTLSVAGRGPATGRRQRRKNRGKPTNRGGGLMERLDERWRRRQEGDL